MIGRRAAVRFAVGLVTGVVASLTTGVRAHAQGGGQGDMQGMSHQHSSGSASRRGSGTGWLPDSTPLRELALSKGAWALSFQGSASAMYDQQYTYRGGAQLALTDWEMVMAMRPVGSGMLHLHAMTSLESIVLGGGGYQELLQTGGTYRHAFLHDRMHPHNTIMELSAQFEQPIGGGLTASLYVAPVGEPAVGPVSFMHRASSQNDPMAPIGHHWQDVSHQSYGAITFGIGTDRLKLEGSLFNPREADEHHPVVDYRDAKLDAYAGRLSWAPTASVVASAWWAFLNTHQRLDPTTRMHRWGASLSTQTHGPGGGDWASTLIWGVNLHHHGAGSHQLLHAAPGSSPHHLSTSLLVESNLEIGTRNAVFVRAERVEKNGEELGFLGGDLTVMYPVQSFTLGATHRVASVGPMEMAFGARGTLNMVPQELRLAYGTRQPMGMALYTQFRPRRAR